jgi:hypothetical protein
MPDLIPYLSFVQCAIGIAIVLGGLMIQAVGTGRDSPMVVHLVTTGLVGWGVWFALLGFQGKADSLPANAMALAVAYAVVVRGRQIRGILSGEAWWRPNAAAKCRRHEYPWGW